MSKYLAILVALMAILFTSNAFAFSPPPAPTNGWYVYDGTGRLSTTQISSLNQKIKSMSDATKNEFGIAFLQGLDGSTIEDAAYATFRAWGIGKHGLDNGVLIMLSLKEHKSRIETGKGVGGEITDLQAHQILEGMRPALRSGDFYGAFNQALDGISSLLDTRAGQKYTVAPPPAPVQAAVPATSNQPVAAAQPSDSGGLSGFSVFLMVITGLGLLSTFSYIIFYLFVIAPNQAEEARRRKREEEERLERMHQQAMDHSYTPSVQHTYHHATSHVSARPSVPLTPSVPNPQPVIQNVEVDTSVVAVAAAATALAEEEREERHRREREREEEAREARRRREEEEDRRRRDEESSSSSWGSSNNDSGGSSWDSGGGFGGGDSGGGGSSDSW